MFGSMTRPVAAVLLILVLAGGLFLVAPVAAAPAASGELECAYLHPMMLVNNCPFWIEVTITHRTLPLKEGPHQIAPNGGTYPVPDLWRGPRRVIVRQIFSPPPHKVWFRNVEVRNHHTTLTFSLNAAVQVVVTAS
jgi:hypothetical protein